MFGRNSQRRKDLCLLLVVELRNTLDRISGALASLKNLLLDGGCYPGLLVHFDYDAAPTERGTEQDQLVSACLHMVGFVRPFMGQQQSKNGRLGLL